jgi:hypothetical protein
MTINFGDQAEFHALFLDMNQGKKYIAVSNESNYIQ